MSNLENYHTKLAALQEIPEDEIRSPKSIPVDVFLQEAENLYHWCKEDKAELTAKGLSAGLLRDLPVRSGALREAQSRWIVSRFTREEAEQEWREKSPLAYDFRNELLHTFRFAYRNKSDLLSRVNAIREGSGHADMIQDLNDLAVLGKENTKELKEINFDLAELDKAASLADEMGNLLGATTNERADSSETLKIRNQAYTHLKEAVDELRAYGQFVFWRNEARLKGYASEYSRRANRRSAARKEDAVLVE